MYHGNIVAFGHVYGVLFEVQWCKDMVNIQYYGI